MAASREPLSTRLLAPIVNVRQGESLTMFMMFAYSFLGMTAYNIVKPITKSKFIEQLGAERLPYALLVMALVVGLIMQAYSRGAGRLPRPWVIPTTQALMAGLLVAFWVLFQTGAAWVPVAFYLIGYGLFGILITSQFWTLANDVYDARQAKRLFGFIGGGATLGGIAGSAILTLLAERVGTENLLMVSVGVLGGCVALVTAIQFRARPEGRSAIVPQERGVGGKEAIRLLRESRHLQTISLVIAFACIGGAIIDQQVSMAAQAFKGQTATDAITAFLGQVQLYTSAIGFVLQVWVTSRLHRFLGIGFALLVLPISLGATGVLILMNAALWSAGLARVADTSFRYTVDKTTREVLFLPLPPEIKYQAKPFVDVTVDRLGKAVGAFLLLVVTARWGFHAQWWHLSYASLAVTVLWVVMATRARRGYLQAFRQSLADRQVEPDEIRLPAADLSTIEMLIDELGHPDDQRVLYAVDLLDALDRRHLITPLLLHHQSRQVRIRVLGAIQRMDAEHAARFDAMVERLLKDDDLEVRAGAVRALAWVRDQPALAVMRSYLTDGDVRVRLSAAAALADSTREIDLVLAENTLEAIARDPSPAARQDLARVLEHVRNVRFRRILISLFFDQDEAVARRAITAARAGGDGDPLFVPPLISLLRNRTVRAEARHALIAFGPSAVDPLGHVLGDTDEDAAVRREIPHVLSGIGDPRAVPQLVAALADGNGGVRFAALAALERLHRVHGVAVPAEPIEKATIRESSRYFTYLGLRYNLFAANGGNPASLLCRALDEKLSRALDRTYRLLALIYPWRDIETARWAIGRGDARARASAAEYLDNLLTGSVRKRILPIVEDLPLAEKVRKGNVFLRTRVRAADETLAQLVHDEDQVLSAAAIQYVESEQRWALADDLDFVLQHRDPHDWYVFEAASWALAGRRLEQARRRALWLEPLPAIELANRLRALPLFAFVPVNDLVRIGAAGRQARYEPGHAIAAGDLGARTLLFVLDGAVTVEGAADTRRVESPSAIALDEVLRGDPFAASVRACDITATLELPHEAFLALLAENPALVRGLFRVMLRDADIDATPLLRGTHGPTPQGSTPATRADAVIALERVELFAGASTADLLALAAPARTAPAEPGAPLLSEAESAAIIVILGGQATVERPDGSQQTTASRGDAIGAYAALAGASAGWRAYAASPSIVLRIESADVLRVLGERVGLLQRVFAGVLRRTPVAGEVSAAPARQ